jgi:hypothetical protein
MWLTAYLDYSIHVRLLSSPHFVRISLDDSPGLCIGSTGRTEPFRRVGTGKKKKSKANSTPSVA